MNKLLQNVGSFIADLNMSMPVLRLPIVLLLCAFLFACSSKSPDEIISIAVTQTLEAATRASNTNQEENVIVTTPTSVPAPTQLETEAEPESENTIDTSVNFMQRNPTSASSSTVPDGALMRLGRGSIETMDLSPDGELIALGGALGIFVYESDSLQEVWFSKTESEIKDLAFSPDGSKLAVGLEHDAEVMILDPLTGKVINQLITEPLLTVSWRGKLDWHPDSVRLAVALERPELHSSSVAMVWDTETSDSLFSFNMPYEVDEGASALAWSPNGELFAAVYEDMGMVWDSSNGQLLNYAPAVEELNNISQHLVDISWYLDSTKIVLGYEFGMTLWDALEDQTEEIIQDYEVFDAAMDGLSGEVAFSKDGDHVALAAATGEIMIWETQNGQFMEPLDGHINVVHTLEWSPDGESLISASFDDRLIVWNIETWEPSEVLLEHTDVTYPIAWSPDSTKLVTGGYGGDEDDPYFELRGIAEVWSSDEPQILYELDSTAAGVAWSTDDNLIVAGDQVFEAGSGNFIRSMEKQELAPFATMISLSSDNKYLAAVVEVGDYYSEALSIWDFESGNLLHTLERYDESGDLLSPKAFSFSPDGTRLAVSYWSEIAIYSVTSGETLQEIYPEELLDHLAWLPDGTALFGIMSITGEFSDVTTDHIYIWDTSSGEVIDSIDMRLLTLYPEFSPDGRYLAFLGHFRDDEYEDQIVIWDISANQPVRILGTLTGASEARFSWSPNSEILSSNQGDGTLILWNVMLESSETLSTPTAPQPLSLDFYLWEDGKFNEKRVAVTYHSLGKSQTYSGSASKFVASNNPLFTISQYEEFRDIRLFIAVLSDNYEKHYELAQELALLTEAKGSVLELRPANALNPGWYCVVGTEYPTYYESLDQEHYGESWWCFEVR